MKGAFTNYCLDLNKRGCLRILRNKRQKKQQTHMEKDRSEHFPFVGHWHIQFNSVKTEGTSGISESNNTY